MNNKPNRPGGRADFSAPANRRARRPVPKNIFDRLVQMADQWPHTGRAVLGVGIFAVVAVLFLALTGRPDLDTQGADTKTAQTLHQEISPQVQALPSTEEKKEEKKDLYFKRQPNLSRDAVLGSWQAAIGQYTAVLQLQKNVYQIIMAEPGTGKRLYSAGVFTMGEDMIVLTPRLDWSDPSTRGGARVPYEILTRAPFPVIAAIMQGKMVWQNPPQSEKRVLSPYKTPLAAGQDINYIVWQRL